MEGCHKYAEVWSDSASREGDATWPYRADHLELSSERSRRPIASYSKRSRMLGTLRARISWASTRDDDSTSPTDAAISSAEDLINSLAPRVLDFPYRIAVSNDGEINFFFGDAAHLFQLLILDNGTLSYHAESEAGELVGSSIELRHFPQLRLLSYLNRD